MTTTVVTKATAYRAMRLSHCQVEASGFKTGSTFSQLSTARSTWLPNTISSVAQTSGAADSSTRAMATAFCRTKPRLRGTR